MRRAAFALALGWAALASAQRSDCPAPRLAPQLMTPPAGTIPRDAALLVGLFPSASSGGPPQAALRRGQRSFPLRTETIAPGLFRLLPNATDRLRGSYDVEGIAGAPALVFGRPGRPSPPSTPVLERAERYAVASGGAERTEVRAHFSFPIPDGTAAIVSYWDDDADADLFVRAVPSQSSVVLYASNALCALPDGASPPPASGGTVRVAFVDVFGQVSALSEARPIE